jgi:hypothetical protein
MTDLSKILHKEQNSMIIIILGQAQGYGEDTTIYAVRVTLKRAQAWCRVRNEFLIVAANPTWTYLGLEIVEWNDWIVSMTGISDLDAMLSPEALKNKDVRRVLNTLRNAEMQRAMKGFRTRYADASRYVVRIHRLRARASDIDCVRRVIKLVRRIDKHLETT